LIQALIDTNIFLTLAASQPGWKQCGELMDRVYRKEIQGLMSTIQISELYTPFKRAGDEEGLKQMMMELTKLKPRIIPVTKAISEISAVYRASIKTLDGRWLPLADSLLLATALHEDAAIIYTLDLDFYNVKSIRVEAPEMPLEEWVIRFGTDRQKALLETRSKK
jgi:predicted nucleic acid-binding protein